MIEPAAYGAAICFGPNTQNFRDVVSMLLDREAAVRVNDGAELTAFVRRCLDDSEFGAGRLASTRRRWCASNKGGSTNLGANCAAGSEEF